MKKKGKLIIIVSVVVASVAGIFAHIIKRKRMKSYDIKDMDDVEIAESDFDDEVIVISKQEEFTDAKHHSSCMPSHLLLQHGKVRDES